MIDRSVERIEPPALPPVKVEIKALVYDDSTNIELFLHQLHGVTKLGEWLESLRLLQMRGAQKNLTYEFGIGKTVEETIDARRARFGLCHEEVMQQLASFRKDSRTTPKEHAVMVVKLANVTYGCLPQNHRQELRLESFMASINHVGLQRYLLAIGGETIEAALRSGK